MRSEYPMMAPLQLAEIKEGRLCLIPETLARVRQFPSNTKWIGVIGAARQGKSFLVKHLSGQNFRVSSAIQSCTAGVWLSEPQPYGNDEYIVYVDSEGTDLGDTRHQHKILVLVCLLLWDGGALIDYEASWGNNSLNALTLLATAHQLIRGAEESGWPHLCFLLRNFNVPMIYNDVNITTEQFLNIFLEPKNDARDADRKLIRDCFQKRMLHTLPTPNDAELAADMLPNGRFLTALTELRTRLDAVLSVKKIGGVVCDGPMVVAFLEECVAKINERGNITMTSAVETVMNVICSGHADEMLASYNSGMKNVLDNLTGDDQILQDTHNNMFPSAVNGYNEKTQGLFPASVAKYLQVLQQNIESQYQLALATNRAVRERKAKEEAARQLAEEQAARERDAQAAAQRLAQEQAARAQEAQAAALRLAQEQAARAEAEQRAKNNETFLNLHGFKINGKRIW